MKILAQRERVNMVSGWYEYLCLTEGEKVVMIEDDWIVGGDLSWSNEQDTIQFDSIDDEGLADWLDDSDWSAEFSLMDLSKALTKKVW